MLKTVKVGSEFLVNTATVNFQSAPTITNLANGGFVVAFTDWTGPGDSNIKAQIFGADGTKAGAEFLVNTETFESQTSPTITGLANGGFVVTWTDLSGLDDTSDNGVKAQIFGADGTKVGSEFIVSTETEFDQINPSITGLSNGGFVITWQDFSGTLGDSSASSIKAQVFGADGTRVGSEFLVNTEKASFQVNPSITGLANGGFVVTWDDESGTLGDSSDNSTKAQVFGADGTRVGSEFLVNTGTASDQIAPTVSGLVNGGFVIAWEDSSKTLGDSSGSGIKAQVFGADGTRVGSEFLVNTGTANNQTSPAITRLADGGFVVTWQDDSGTLGDSSGASIKAQVFGANGTRVGPEFLVNTDTANSQIVPAVTGLADGGFAVTWLDNVTFLNGDAVSLKAQIFNLIDPSTDGDDILTGSSADDEIEGRGGNDQLDGLAGNDTLVGGTGDDTYVVDSLGDKVVERVNEGNDTVRTDLARYVLGANVETLTFTSNIAHIGVGNALDNRLIGGSGDDWLDGRGGADRLEGRAGNDRYVVDNAGDQVIEATSAGTDKVIASVSHTLAANVENLDLAGTGAINGTGNAGGNTIIGNAAGNTLNGLDGNDRLVGDAGADVLIGGLGKDVLTGGAGADRFVFDTAPNRATNLDKVTDFVSGADVLVLDKDVFSAFTAGQAIGEGAFRSGANVNAAQDADDRLIYNTTNGVLSYDADGNGAGQAVQIAVLVGKPALTFEDFLIAV